MARGAQVTIMTAVCVLLAASGAAAAPPVHLELATDSGFPITGGHKWLESLKDLGFASLQIRGGRQGDQPSLTENGEGRLLSYRAVGILTSRNELLLPGGRFRFGDTAGIAAWMNKVSDGGKEAIKPGRSAFGLTEEQIVALYDELSAPVDFSTAGRPASEVVKSLVRRMTTTVTIDDATRARLEQPVTLDEELLGVSRGTALAAALSRCGLALRPQRQAGRVIARVAPREPGGEHWPVGWPSERPPRTSAPVLFTFLNVEIVDTPLTETVEAVRGRLEMPVLWDHDALARHGIDRDQPVSLPSGRTYYKKILDRALAQAKLKMDIRVDEAGHAFLWITTIRP